MNIIPIISNLPIMFCFQLFKVSLFYESFQRNDIQNTTNSIPTIDTI